VEQEGLPPITEDDEEQRSSADRGRQYDLARLMAFSDGVFAIAITLLVLNVSVPAVSQSDAMSRLPSALLRGAGPPLTTFGLSFFLVGFYWIRHHELFRSLLNTTAWLLWLNLLLLFLICLLPFSSSVVGHYPATVLGAEVYATNLAAIALAFWGLYLYATRSRQVRLPSPAPGGFVGGGVIWPLAVVVLVMLLAPINLTVAYVIGATLIAVVGLYSTVRRAIRSAPLSGKGEGRLLFRGGVGDVTVRAGAARLELFRARSSGREPSIAVAGNAVDVRYRAQFLNRRVPSLDFALNAAIPWRLEVTGWVMNLTADFRGLRVAEVTVTGTAVRVELRLPRPTGTVPIHVRGDIYELSISRPAAAPIRATIANLLSDLLFDQRPIDALDSQGSHESSGYADASDRYDVEFEGEAKRVVIATY
jgi:uncharacterized membrane protein